MITWSKETFNEKIDHFSGHKGYEALRKNADKAISSYTGFGLECIIHTDFMDRIIAMPLDYIQDWLDGKNELKWREQDKKMLAAIKGGYVDILEQYPNAEIHHIAESAAKFYIECGFEIINNGKKTFAIKKNETKPDANKVMTRDEMIAFIKGNPNVKIKHEYFSPDEYIYSKENGEVYTEEGYLFEDWYSSEFTGHNGIRMRKGDGWETGWSLYKENEDGKKN